MPVYVGVFVCLSVCVCVLSDSGVASCCALCSRTIATVCSMIQTKRLRSAQKMARNKRLPACHTAAVACLLWQLQCEMNFMWVEACLQKKLLAMRLSDISIVVFISIRF